jgi:hypothetical protein
MQANEQTRPLHNAYTLKSIKWRKKERERKKDGRIFSNDFMSQFNYVELLDHLHDFSC